MAEVEATRDACIADGEAAGRVGCAYAARSVDLGLWASICKGAGQLHKETGWSQVGPFSH